MCPTNPAFGWQYILGSLLTYLHPLDWVSDVDRVEESRLVLWTKDSARDLQRKIDFFALATSLD